jgi:hypothetical protein
MYYDVAIVLGIVFGAFGAIRSALKLSHGQVRYIGLARHPSRHTATIERSTKTTNTAMRTSSPEFALRYPGTVARLTEPASPAQQVLNALTNSGYDWRSVEGISDETGIPESQVTAILEEDLGGVVVKSFDQQYRDTYLYTTRNQYRRIRGFWDDFLTLTCDRI